MNLLLAEDDAILADALTVQLRRSGFEVEHAPNGAVAEYLLLKNSYDIAILDLGLPMVDGLTVLKRLRAARRGLPVLVLTALDSLDDRVSGLNAGADDYLTKPFDFPELQARLHALLRRGRPLAAGQDLAQLNFDRAARRASVQGETLELSPREWLLLDLLLQERDRVVTKEQIVAAWAQDRGENGGGNSVEVYIHRLRRKLEGSGLQIRTVRGLGYLLEADSSAGGAPAAP
ncbi:response regulator transcription factor [Paucibacter sp. DJ1R-11]|uniref:response regulator transcription factor n=1 Tax=Paucibacter sp. DJ1R-11 TaxID=2893556 RepID=UPI0021E4CFCD|nr:response regulator transcription factor [Paucibacter sp. DJ1R-11]MCV2364434.1 response regulator transcription factor [Paucibacter sp. DJ1R-11]